MNAAPKTTNPRRDEAAPPSPRTGPYAYTLWCGSNPAAAYTPAVADIDFPDDLIELESAAWQEIQAGRLTVATAGAVQAAVTAYAAKTGTGRYDIEMGLKKTVRHPAVG